MPLLISVTDQAPIHANSSSAESPLLSVKLAQACERWGYHRYWMAEHHNSGIFACPCPEILIGHIASQTERIKVGSGGVMLSHYSPYKVAEQFRMLALLYPDRVDLGIGRAPGGDVLARHWHTHISPPIAKPMRNRQKIYNTFCMAACRLITPMPA
ncbi:MsnO8 family LLM class oxidoreductase [Dasania marina]|uniref:MsnO8 family LLM class oxidoreductase n=1 Tax=Dasania marina TaxID=471499 RepID=UPI0004BC3BA5|nr:MsnO8 family LLM class oxidoreductase [Dasania marina]